MEQQTTVQADPEQLREAEAFFHNFIGLARAAIVVIALLLVFLALMTL